MNKKGVINGLQEEQTKIALSTKPISASSIALSNRISDYSQVESNIFSPPCIGPTFLPQTEVPTLTRTGNNEIQSEPIYKNIRKGLKGLVLCCLVTIRTEI